jgi:tetratricopeptide (TPR) repeat protein
MKRSHTVTVAALLFVGLFTASILALRQVENARGQEASLEEVLYMPSGKTLKRVSLGYSGLLADIYWTRAVQYYGGHHLHRARHYELLAPLLDITTDLDPHLIVAYQTGSIFLSQRVPDGAGQPDKAVALLEKGIRENPEFWRLYFTLGFVHYEDRRDYQAAEQAFEKGSEVPGALPWMKVMAARMAEHADDPGTAMVLWKAVYENNTEKNIRETAMSHILSLEADVQIEALEKRIQAYREKTGRLPLKWNDMVQSGWLQGVPQDPAGNPYKLMPDGTVQVENPAQFPFLGQGRRERK